MLKLTTVNQCYIYLTVLGESIECEQYSAVGVKCKSYIEYICSAFELLLLMLISYLLSTLDDQLYRLVLPNLKKIYVYQKEKKLMYSHFIWAFVPIWTFAIMEEMASCYQSFLLLHYSNTGGPLLTLFFETLEKQPCKQKNV